MHLFKINFCDLGFNYCTTPFRFSKRRKSSYYSNICIPTPTELFLTVLNEY